MYMTSWLIAGVEWTKLSFKYELLWHAAKEKCFNSRFSPHSPSITQKDKCLCDKMSTAATEMHWMVSTFSVGLHTHTGSSVFPMQQHP